MTTPHQESNHRLTEANKALRVRVERYERVLREIGIGLSKGTLDWAQAVKDIRAAMHAPRQKSKYVRPSENE